MSNMKLGAHVSTAGGVSQAPGNAKSIGAEAMQIFTRNQRRWSSPPIAASERRKFAKELGLLKGFAPVLAHDSYLINLAARDKKTLERSRVAFRDELERASALGIPIVVAHPGSHVGAGVAQGLRSFTENLDQCLDEAEEAPEIIVALETTAGQGTALGSDLEHFRDIFAGSRHTRRLALCVDTCHVFASGYDIGTEEPYEAFVEHIEGAIGTSKVVAWHINDSKHGLGSRRDRHANIGEGELGVNALRRVVNDSRWKTLPGCLETPGGPEAWKMEIEILRGRRGLPTQHGTS